MLGPFKFVIVRFHCATPFLFMSCQSQIKKWAVKTDGGSFEGKFSLIGFPSRKYKWRSLK